MSDTEFSLTLKQMSLFQQEVKSKIYFKKYLHGKICM